MISTTRSLLLAFLLAAPSQAAQEAPDAAPAEQPKRVVYLPEIVKAQLREEIKREVLEQAKKEGWAAPNAVPDWLQRFKLNGDLRVRLERDLFARGNANAGEFPDFNGINASKPFDVNFVDPSNERYLDVDQNRTRPRLRARLGVDADVGQGFSAGLRVASGEGATPGSANQTLGGSGGNFSKYQFWLDRAFFRYDTWNEERRGLSITIGRFENPFFNTEMLWSPDLNMDGIALQAKSAIGGGLVPFLTAGAFPLYITSLSFPAERTEKFPSTNKWLYAVQAGADYKNGDYSLKLGAAFFAFDKVEGHTSDQCDTNLSYVTCNTDDSRPPFAQKGNTYLALRMPSDAALQLEASAAVPRYQFFGLASRFRELVATARLEVRLAPQLLFGVEGEYVHNAGFKKSQIAGLALNNHAPTPKGEVLGPYDGGSDGVLVRAALGSPTQSKRWDWRVRLGYRSVQSDAVLDALNDPDFGLGGTNLKGYGIDGTLFLADGVSLAARWLSANQIAGPPYAVDVLHVDLLARF